MFPHQFALVPRSEAPAGALPSGWVRRPWKNDWMLLHEEHLPLHEEHSGLILGWKMPGGGGRWLRIGRNRSLAPDCCASLSVFTDDRQRAVSSIALAEALDLAGPRRNESAVLGELRERTGTWYPAGLSPFENWRLVLPGAATRIGGIDRPSDALVEDFVATTASHLEQLASRFPLEIALSAGRDSRMVAACSRSVRARTTYYVDPPKPPHRGPEVELSSALAEILELSHRIGGDPTGDASLVFGFGGELARAHYWPKSIEQPPSVEELAGVLGYDLALTEEAFLRSPLESWLIGLNAASPAEIWDRLYLEQRMACTMSPLLYERDRPGAPSFFGLGQPLLIQLMTSLDERFRRKWKLADQVCRKAWPASALLPFNTVDYPMGRRLSTLAALWTGRGADFVRARRNQDLHRWLAAPTQTKIGGLVAALRNRLS